MSAARPRYAPHPVVVALLAVPALLVVLTAATPWCGLVMIAVCVVGAFLRGIRFGTLVAAVAFALFGVLAFGLNLWLPQGAAVSGAVRITATGVLLAVPFALLGPIVLADTLVRDFRVPYRVVDVIVLSERFAAHMRADFRLIRNIARIRARGSATRQAALTGRALTSVLVGSFRHSDELALAMDARGFGAHPTRTTHYARRIRASDIVLLIAAWTATGALAWILNAIAV